VWFQTLERAAYEFTALVNKGACMGSVMSHIAHKSQGHHGSVKCLVTASSISKQTSDRWQYGEAITGRQFQPSDAKKAAFQLDFPLQIAAVGKHILLPAVC
jgi:hypothetical protein